MIASSRKGTNAPSYYHHDAIGSVVALSNNSGSLTDSYSYEAFSLVRARTGTNSQPFRYVGNAFDSGSKLYDSHARAYDPAVGRFTSKDPVRGYAHLPQTLNPYVYGRDNPYRYPDPHGRDTVGICTEGSGGGGLGTRVAICGVTDGNTVKQTVSGSAGVRPVPGSFGGHSVQLTNADSVDRLHTSSLEELDVCLSVQGGVLGAVQGTYCGGEDPVSGETIHTAEIGYGADATDLFPAVAAIPFYGELDATYTRVMDIPGITWLSEQLLPGLREYYLNSRAEK